MIRENRPVRPSDITDGFSQTVAVSEWVVGPGSPNPLPRDALGTIFDLGLPLNDRIDLDRFAAACLGVDPSKQAIAENEKGHEWLYGSYTDTLYNHNLSINMPSCMSQGSVYDGAYSVSSRHSGGAQSVFADGHVRFFRGGLDRTAWKALGTRNGGETLSDPNWKLRRDDIAMTRYRNPCRRRHAIRIHSRPLALLALLFLAAASKAGVGDITDPTSNPVETWMSGNNQVVTFNGTGGYRYKIRIYDTATPTIEYSSNVGYCNGNPTDAEIGVPKAAPGNATNCTLEVTITDMMNGQLAKTSVPVKISTP